MLYFLLLFLLLQVHTVAVGAAIGMACLLLAAGTKGKRFMMPHAKSMSRISFMLLILSPFLCLVSSANKVICFSHDSATSSSIIWVAARQ